MIRIAVLGYGTVGSGVVKVIQTNAKIIAKRAAPRPRQDMRIDGTLWTVDDAVDLHGLIRINLYRNGS